MLEINLPDVVAEVTACCTAYEQALVGNDVAALRGFFWDSPLAVRYGVGEQLYGAEQIAAFRQARVINFSERQPQRLTILALGRDVAVAMLEFSVVVETQPRQGRQTQVWARFAGVGWRVTAAHVSHAMTPPPAPWSAYATAAAAALGLPLAAEHRPGVHQNLATVAALAAPLLAFPLPAESEPAPVFQP